MKINDFGVGTRMGAGFSIVLALVVIMAVTGIVKLSSILKETDAMTDRLLVLERLAGEWGRPSIITVLWLHSQQVQHVILFSGAQGYRML